jgi:glycosyltransferase involved in cell wall biosynthesis
MACGLPVIAARTGGIPEIIRHEQDGILVPSGNTDETASALIRILNDDILRQNLARSAFKRAESFGLEEHVNHLFQVFADVLMKQSFSLRVY